MSTKERIFVYLIGLGIGILLVSYILSRRAEKAEQASDPWVEHNRVAVAAGAEPLPESLPEPLQKGRILDFGYLPNAESPTERVWHLNFDESYPYVRVVEQIADGQLTYMAADQIVVELKPGIDVTELQPMLDAVGLRLRMFNRKEHLMVLGVLSTDLDSVPTTIAAVQPWAESFVAVKPDYIQLQPKRLQ